MSSGFQVEYSTELSDRWALIRDNLLRVPRAQLALALGVLAVPLALLLHAPPPAVAGMVAVAALLFWLRLWRIVHSTPLGEVTLRLDDDGIHVSRREGAWAIGWCEIEQVRVLRRQIVLVPASAETRGAYLVRRPFDEHPQLLTVLRQHVERAHGSRARLAG